MTRLSAVMLVCASCIPYYSIDEVRTDEDAPSLPASTPVLQLAVPMAAADAQYRRLGVLCAVELDGRNEMLATMSPHARAGLMTKAREMGGDRLVASGQCQAGKRPFRIGVAWYVYGKR